MEAAAARVPADTPASPAAHSVLIVDDHPQAQVLREWHFQVGLSTEQLKRVDVVPLLHDLVSRMHGWCARHPKLFLVLSELVGNAMDHGVLGLDSLIKLESDGFQRYLTLRQQKLAALTTGAIDVSVTATDCDGRPMLSILVKDTGSGFDFRHALERPPKVDAAFGRGISLLKRVCEQVEYRGCGNEVEVLFAVEPPEKPPERAPAN